MTNSSIFEFLDPMLLTPTQVAHIGGIQGQFSDQSIEAFAEVVKWLMRSDAPTYNSAIKQARRLFTRQLEAVEQIENSHRGDLADEGLMLLNAQVDGKCKEARRLLMGSLRALNSEYEHSQLVSETRHMEDETKGERSANLFQRLYTAFLVFYRDVEDVELQLAAAKESASLLRLASELAAMGQDLQDKRLALARLETKIGELQRRTAQRERMRSEGQESREWIMGVFDGREVGIFEKDELEAFLREREQLKQQIEEIEQIQNAIANSAGPDDMRRVLRKSPMLAPVAKMVDESTLAKQKLQSDLEIVRPLVEAQIQLQADKERYSTSDIVEWAKRELKLEMTTNDVTYRLDRLVAENKLGKKKPGQPWSLTTSEFLFVTDSIRPYLRKKARRKSKQR